MDLKRPYLIIPKLIEQPTWGGNYILANKGWREKKLFSGLKIGQSYELFSASKIRTDLNSSLDSSFTGELGSAMDPDKIFYDDNKNNVVDLRVIIDQDPLDVLGEKALNKYGKQMRILIKFTQAKGNSFQLHVKEKDQGRWRYKPESWYFFEKGLITLGIKKGTDLKKYKDSCNAVNLEMQKISRDLKAKKITYDIACDQIKLLLKKENPWQYVNLLQTESDQLVDLSSCGLHHSWEENEKTLPLGNVVYEISLDEMDPDSTVRSFDKGKISSTGAIRKVDIEDYFKYADTGENNNNPSTHLVKAKRLLSADGIEIFSLLRTKHYCLDKIIISHEYKGEHTKNSGSFHHLFVKSGKLRIITSNNELVLSSGHSCFVPSTVKSYLLKTNERSEILKTFID